MRSLSVLLSLASLSGAAGAQVTLTNTTWTLSQMTAGTQPVALPAGTGRPTLRLDGRVAAGSTGCNTYRGPYTERSGLLTLGSLVTTRRDCPGPVGTLESRYLNLLQQVTRYQLSGSTLTLFASNRDRLVFQSSGTPVPPAAGVSLDGTWVLSGRTAVLPVAGSVPSLTFQGSRMSGTGGCNRLTGTVQLRGRTVMFGPVASTRMACAPAVNLQETAFLRFLANGTLQVDLQAGSLSLRNTAGQTLLFRRSAGSEGSGSQGYSATLTSPSLIQGRTFVLTAVNGGPAPQTAQPVTLSFEGGRVGGTDGCNSFGGAYRLEGSQLVLTEALVTTLRACPEEAGGVGLTELLAARPAVTATATRLTLAAEGTTLTFSLR